MSSGFRQTNELWKDIQDETSPDIKRLKMIEMAILLLKYASLTDDQLRDLSGIPGKEMLMKWQDRFVRQ